MRSRPLVSRVRLPLGPIGRRSRLVQHIFVLTLSGTSRRFDRIDDAIQFIADHDQAEPAADFVRYQLNVRYSNAEEIRACFATRGGCGRIPPIDRRLSGEWSCTG